MLDSLLHPDALNPLYSPIPRQPKNTDGLSPYERANTPSPPVDIDQTKKEVLSSNNDEKIPKNTKGGKNGVKTEGNNPNNSNNSNNPNNPSKNDNGSKAKHNHMYDLQAVVVHKGFSLSLTLSLYIYMNPILLTPLVKMMEVFHI